MIHSNEILGKTVVGAGGLYIGEVYDIGVAPSSWALEYLYVKLSTNAIKTLGLKKTLLRYRVKVPTALIAEFGVIIKLKKTLQELNGQLDIAID
jgi:sporulation protein YlmC with PRC-barrel domain